MEHFAKIVHCKNSFGKSLEMFDRALNTPLSEVSRGSLSGKIYVNYQKRKQVLDKFPIHNFMNLIQSYDISQEKKRFGKRFSFLAAFVLLHKQQFPLRFCVGSLKVIKDFQVNFSWKFSS